MQCVKMQSSTNPATLLDLSTACLSNSLQLNASASGIPACIPLTSGESYIGGSGQDEICNRSSWIRRLKPRDGLNLSNGGLAEDALGILNSEKGDSSKRTDISPSILHVGCFSQDRASIAGRVRPNWKVDGVADAKRRKSCEQKDCDVAKGLRMDACINESGKSVAVTATAPLPNVGFGPWVNLSSCRKPDKRSDSGVGSKNVIGTVASAHESSKDVQGGFRAPPLSPIQGKLGLPPRPPSQKTPGFHSPSKIAPIVSGMGRGVFYQLDRQVSDAPLNREDAPARQLVDAQDKELSKCTEAASARSGSSFQIKNASEQSFPFSARENGKGISDCGKQCFASTSTSMANSNSPGKQSRTSVVERSAHQLGHCSDVAAVQVEHGRRGVVEDLHIKMFGETVKEPICADLPSDSRGLALQLEVPGPAMEVLKAPLKNGSLAQMVSTESKGVASQQSPSGAEKAAASALASASLPWEMFVEPAGASKKAREQFVEVYYRARDELKNQRMFQRASTTMDMDGGPKLTLGPGDAVSDYRVERQFMKQEQHSIGHSQVQGRLKISSQTSEHLSLSLASNLKEQQAVSLTESKGPVSILANERSGSHRDTTLPLNSGTPCKRLEGFRRLQTLSEGMVSVSVKTLVQEGDQNATGERLDERSIVFNEGSKPREKDSQNFSRNSFANPKELISKLNEDIKYNGSGRIAKVSHQLDGDRQESIPLVSKRIPVTFEDHDISKVAEKGAFSQARPDIWLQRWHPTAVHNSIGLPDSQVPSDGKKDGPVKYLALGLKKFKDGDGVGAFSRVREVKDVAADNERGMKSFNSSSLKTLPSAAAMAIVGTAARQFCCAQPHRKGSFAFWSGFGVSPPRKSEPLQEKGKGKMFVEADVNPHNC